MAGLALATAAMTICVWPLREINPGLVALGAQALIGGAIYAFMLVALDVGGLRKALLLRKKDQTPQ
jgi:hypothetical protein